MNCNSCNTPLKKTEDGISKALTWECPSGCHKIYQAPNGSQVETFKIKIHFGDERYFERTLILDEENEKDPEQKVIPNAKLMIKFLKHKLEPYIFDLDVGLYMYLVLEVENHNEMKKLYHHWIKKPYSVIRFNDGTEFGRFDHLIPSGSIQLP